MTPTRKLGELFYELGVRTEGLKKDLDQSERAFGKLTSFVLKNPVVALTAVGTAALGAAVKATQMAATIDTAMRKVAAAVPQGTVGLQALRQELERISLATGKSQEELSGVAEAIARQGADSLEDVAQRLRAVVDVSQASGVDLQTVIAGLDQTLDLFGLSAAASTQVLAELFSVTRGGAQLEDTFAALQAAAPGIQKLGLDLGTSARALERLGQSGLSPKQAAGELKKLAESGAEGRAEIEALAAAIPKAANPMASLAQAARDVNDAATNVGPRLRQEISATLIQLGTEILPSVNALFAQLLATVQRFRGGTTEDLAQAFTTVISLGRSVLPVLASNDWNAASEKIRTVQRSILQLSDAALAGRVDLQQFGVEGLGLLANQIAKFSTQRRLFSPAQQKELTAFLELITKAQAELVKLNTVGGGGATRPAGGSPAGRGAGGALDTELAARIEEANRALDAQKEKAAANAEAIEQAVADSMLQLATLAGDTVGVLTLQIAALTKQFRKLGASDAEIKLIVAPLEVARKVATALNGALRTITIPESARAQLGLLPKSMQSAATASQSLAGGLSDVLDVALGIATAIEGVNDRTTRLISGAAQAAGGFAKLASLAGEALSAARKLDPKFTGSGLGALFSSGAGLASALPGIGAIVGGLASLAGTIGQEDPATRALREALDRNAQRLEEFTSSVGELVQLTVAGADVAAVRGIATTFDREVGRDQQTDQPIIATFDRSSADLLAELRSAGVGLKELQQLAQELGVTFADAEFPTAAELRQLQQFIAANGLKKLTDSLSGQLKLLELQARIDPDAFAGIAGVIQRIAVLTGDRGVPALRDALAGIDLASTDGPAQAMERLKQLLVDFTAGDIDLALLGDLSPEAFGEAIADLIESIRAAAPALRSPAEKFQAAIEAFGVAVELGTLTAEEKLAKATDLFGALFPELAGSLDTSSAAAFQESIRTIIDGFAADGDLTDAEQAQIAVLRALLGAFEGATPAAEQLADALSVLSDRFEIFATSAAEQIEAILTEVTSDASLGRAAGFAILKGLTDGLDLATTEGQAELRERAKAIFDQLAAGGVTTEEQAIIDTLKRLLGLAVDVANEAAAAAAEAVAEADRVREARDRERRGILDGAEREIRVNDVTDPAEQLQIRVRALGAAFPELAAALRGLDLATQDGRDALEAWIRTMVESPEALEQLASATGQSIDELLAILLGLEDGADAAAEAVETLADKLSSAFDEIDFDVALNGIKDPIALLEKYARGISATIPEIEQALAGIDLKTVSGRRRAEAALRALGNDATDPVLRSAILNILDRIRALDEASVAGGDVGAALGSSGGGLQNVQSASSITEVTANRWLDVMTTDLALARERNTTLNAILATVAGSAVFQPPALAGGFSGGAGVVNNIALEIPIYFQGPVTTANAAELGAELQRAVFQVVTQQLAAQLAVAQRLRGKADA